MAKIIKIRSTQSCASLQTNAQGTEPIPLHDLVFISLDERWKNDKFMGEIYSDAVAAFHIEFNKYHVTWKAKRTNFAAFPVNMFSNLCEILLSFVQNIGTDCYDMSLYVPLFQTAYNVISLEQTPLLFAPATFINGCTAKKYERKIINSCAKHPTLNFKGVVEERALIKPQADEIILVVFESRRENSNKELYLEAWQNFHRDFDTYHETWMAAGRSLAAFPLRNLCELTGMLEEFISDIPPDFYQLKIYVPLFKSLLHFSFCEHGWKVFSPVWFDDKAILEFEGELLRSCPSSHKTLDLQSTRLMNQNI